MTPKLFSLFIMFSEGISIFIILWVYEFCEFMNVYFTFIFFHSTNWQCAFSNMLTNQNPWYSHHKHGLTGETQQRK